MTTTSILLKVWALSAVAAVSVLAQEPMPGTNLACIESLTLPTRGLLAARAGHSGTVEAVVNVTSADSPPEVILHGDNPLLEGEVQVALSLSRFGPRCAGSRISFSFVFKLEDPPTDSIVPPAVRFMPPNRFELTFRRVKANLDPGRPIDNKKKLPQQKQRN